MASKPKPQEPKTEMATLTAEDPNPIAEVELKKPEAIASEPAAQEPAAQEPEPQAPAPAAPEQPKEAPKPQKIKCVMMNWRIAKIGGIEYIFGNVHEHKDFAKGEPVQSSAILRLDLQKMICETEKEIITLGVKSA